MHGKTVILGVSGGIAAYKSCELASRLTQAGVKVITVLTDSALQFVTPLTFQALTQQPVHTSLWPESHDSQSGVTAAMAHIGLAGEADAIIIAPATANTIATHLLPTVMHNSHAGVLPRAQTRPRRNTPRVPTSDAPLVIRNAAAHSQPHPPHHKPGATTRRAPARKGSRNGVA